MVNHWGKLIKDNDNLVEIKSANIIGKIPEVDTTDKEVFFRGESRNHFSPNGDTRLLPSVFRGADEKLFYYDALTNFPKEFANLPNLSKLAKMQHFNYPTRLLDLTTNPLVALWFACSDYNRYEKAINKQANSEAGYFYVITTKKENVLTCDSDRALLLACLSKIDDSKEKVYLQSLIETAITNGIDEINEKYIDEIKLTYRQEASIFGKFIGEANRERAAFSKYKTNPKDILSTFIVRPMIENERQRKQEGLFAIFGLQSTIYTNSTAFEIKRYIIPSYSKPVILKQLDKLGVNQSTLFDDLENRAKYIFQKQVEK